MMRLSIITINYNNIDGLKKTIDSVIFQTFKDFEWIVIDGGSTDGSKELIEQYAEHISYWVSEPDKGIYNAMNKGIKMANGVYLQFLNSGDWLCDDTTLERCFSHGFDADVVYGNLYLSDENGLEEVCYADSLTLRFFYNQTLCHNSTFIRRLLFENILYDESLKLVSDWEFFLIQIKNNSTFEHINEFVIVYDMSGISSVNGELAVHERDVVIQREIPKALQRDYRKMDEMEAQLNQDRVKKVIEYSRKKKFYRKIISGCLHFIELLDGKSK